MSRGFRENSVRVAFLLAVFGFLAIASPGCGEAPSNQEGGDKSPIPPTLEQSNKNMENFMKSQTAKKK